MFRESDTPENEDAGRDSGDESEMPAHQQGADDGDDAGDDGPAEDDSSACSRCGDPLPEAVFRCPSCDAVVPGKNDGRHPPGSLRELIAIALPLVLSAGSLSLMNFCDRLFLTGYSEAAVAASLPAQILHWVLISLPLGTAFYANTFVAQYDGAGRRERVGRSMWQAVILSFGTGILLLGLVPLAPSLIALIGHDASVRADETWIFTALCAGSIPILLAPTLACFYIGRGRSHVVMWANIASVVLNLALDPLLIYGLWGFPEWGAFGAAVATVCGRSLACLVYLVLMATSDDAKPYDLWGQRGFDPALFKRMLRFGLPNGFFWFVDVTAFSVMVFLVGRIGLREQVATTLAFNLNALAFIPMIGIGHSISTLVGRRIGEQRSELAVRSTWVGFRVAGGYMAIWAAFYVFAPAVVVAPYVWMNEARLARGADRAVDGRIDATEAAALLSIEPTDVPELIESGELTAIGDGAERSFDVGEVVELARTRFDAVRELTMVLLLFVAVYSVFDAMAVVFSNAVRGAGDTRFSMLFTLVSSWLLWAVPMIVLSHYGAGLHSMWTACTLYIVVVGTGFLLRFLGGKWKSMKVIEDEPPEDLRNVEATSPDVGVVAVPNPEIGQTVVVGESVVGKSDEGDVVQP